MAANAPSWTPKKMREHFHVPDNYFLSHSVGCLPKVTETALSENFFGPWKTGSNWAEWMPVLDEFRSGLARILSVTPDTICPQVTVSSALTKILHSRPVDPQRNEILLSREAFPTIGFVVKQAMQAGYEMRFIDGLATDAQSWTNAASKRTAFIHATHALSNTSHLLPIKHICALARNLGALSVIDVAQSVGVVPLDPLRWKANFLIGTGVKFLCFGPGACFLYVAKNILPKCEPIDVGWFSHENPFEMKIENFQYSNDAMRFFGGTPSPAPLIAANAAMQFWFTGELLKAKLKIQGYLDYLCRNVPEEYMVSPRWANKRGGTLCIAPNDRHALRANLAAENILHDERKEGFRFSVHGYTSPEDCDTLLGAVKRSL